MSRITRIRALPWLVLFQLLMLARDRWSRLEPADRARLVAILKASGGKPHKVPRDERDELRRIAAKLDLVGAARDLSPLGRRKRFF